MDFSTGPCFCELLALRFLDLIFHAVTPSFYAASGVKGKSYRMKDQIEEP
jgi:hypothetical protein